MRSEMEGTCGRTEANLTTELLVSNSGWLPVVPLVIVTIQSNPIHKNKKRIKILRIADKQLCILVDRAGG